MNIRRYMRIQFLMLLALALFPTAAHAGLSSPNSSATFSADRTQVLIMRSPEPKYDGKPNVTLPDGRTLLIRDHFPKSGLYDTTTLAPIWQVDWYSLDRHLRWSPDLRFVARINLHAFDHDWAIECYDRGKIIQTINCADLLCHLRSMWLLPYATWDWWVVWYDHITIDAGRLHVSTPRRTLICFPHLDLGYQEHYEFDLATGTLLSSQTTGTWILATYLIATLFLLTGLLVLSIHLWRFHGKAFLRFLPRATVATTAAFALGIWPAFLSDWSYLHPHLARGASSIALAFIVVWLTVSRMSTPWRDAARWLWPELVLAYLSFQLADSFCNGADIVVFASDLVVVGGGTLAAATLALSLLQRFRPPPSGPHCPKCHYCLIGTPEDRCPECGRPFTFHELHISPPDLQPPSQ